MAIRINNVRLSFPRLFRAEAGQADGPNAKKKYSATLLIGKDDTANIQKISDAMAAAAKGKWGEKAEGIFAELKAGGRICMRDGESKAKYEGYSGCYFISASRNEADGAPRLFDKNPQKMLTEADGRMYSGCYVNASIDIWAQDNKFGKRLNATLAGLQFCGDGDAFTGGGAASSDDFDNLADQGAPADGAPNPFL